MTRRQAILGMIAASVTIPAGMAVRFTWGGYDSDLKFRHLSPGEATVLTAIFHCLVPPTPPFAGVISDEEFLAGADAFLDVLSARERHELTLLLAATEYGFPLSKFKLRKFTQLSHEDQVELVESLEKAGTLLGHLFGRGLKALVFSAYFNHPKVQMVLGHHEWCGA